MRSKIDWKKVKRDFPIFERGRALAYLDNAATTQKPRCVIDAECGFYENSNANVHRGVYALSASATEIYEQAHEKTASFIGANGMQEIVFTRNTTESLNVVAGSIGKTLQAGDEVVLTLMEHHSNIVPWQQLQKRGIKLRYAGFDSEGRLDYDGLARLIGKKTKVVSFVHASNVLGSIHDAKRICKVAHDAGALAVVDGAQSVPHMKVGVKSMDCDFLAFSAHKMLGPMGMGVLYGKEGLLEKMEPFLYGGGMISKVTEFEASWNGLPWKFEAGTPNVAGAVGVSAAMGYLEKIGMESVQMHERDITEYALKRLAEIKGIEIYGGANAQDRMGVVSFNVKGIHPHDVAALLDEDKIAIRAGHACAQPLLAHLGVDAVCRASFYIYNSKEEINRLCASLEKIKKMFGS